VESQENALSEFDVRAAHYLGRCYDLGLGVQVDSKKAVEYLQKAADQGDAVAQNVLATIYDMGRGVARDPQNAAYWYRVSAEQGYHHAQYNLGVCYRDGFGVKQHTEKAIYWFVKAAKQRNTPTMKKILIQSMISVVQELTRIDINNGFFFSAPVDKKKYPKYRKVKKPKDLSTIARNLLTNSYNSQDEVAQDIRQVFQNAIKISPSHAISKLATLMLGKFEKWYEEWQAYQAYQGIQKKP
jgi:DNA-binding cell septation regulator SpoVG